MNFLGPADLPPTLRYWRSPRPPVGAATVAEPFDRGQGQRAHVAPASRCVPTRALTSRAALGARRPGGRSGYGPSLSRRKGLSWGSAAGRGHWALGLAGSAPRVWLRLGGVPMYSAWTFLQFSYNKFPVVNNATRKILIHPFQLGRCFHRIRLEKGNCLIKEYTDGNILIY